MKLRFLGTGTSQGVPVISCQCDVCASTDYKDKRLRTSILVQDEKTNIVIDCSPDFRQQMLDAKCDKLDAIVFTHEHQDHIAGLDDVRAFNFSSKKPLTLWSTERVARRLKHTFDYAFGDNPYPGAPQLNVQTFDIESFRIGTFNITPIYGMHGDWPVTVFRIGKLTYITDINKLEQREKNKIKGSEVIVVNALRKSTHHSHFSLQQAIDLINEFKPAKAFLIHMSHQMGLHEQIEKELPENIFLSYDGLEIDL